MKPITFSATAMQVAELCLARYQAEHISRGSTIGNAAATLGTAVHTALEIYVKTVYLEKVQSPDSVYLLELFRMSYMSTFDTADTDTVEYSDGIEMLSKWFMRTTTYLEKVEILSCEQKLNFPIKTTLGEIPFNYIFDRSDKVTEGEYKVVDYKTQRWAIPASDLKKKIQVRAYGLAMQILYPDAKEIWVELDFLRHNGPVGVLITRQDNINAWNFFKRRAQQIIDAPEVDPPETLNPECRFCIRKQVCSALKAHVSVGGILSLGDAKEIVDHRAALEYQKAAIASAIDEIDRVIIAEARETETISWDTDDNVMEIGASSTRAIDADRAERVLGPKLFAKYGNRKFSVTVADKLLKGQELTDAQKSELRNLFYKTSGEPRVKVRPKSALEE